MASKKIKNADDPYALVDREIDRVNKKDLKSMPVSLLRSGGKLYVQGTFPTKDNPRIKKQSKVALRLNADPNFLFEAKKRAIEIGMDLMLDRWVWPDDKSEDSPLTVAQFSVLHQERYQNKNGFSDDTLLYWKKDYGFCFKKLVQDKPPSLEMCRRIAEEFPPGTKARVRHVKAYCQLLKLAGIDDTTLAVLRSSYNPNQVNPRDVPTIDSIRGCYYNLAPEWRFFYFLLACFGLRGTEAHPKNIRLDDLDNGEVTVFAGKTKKWRYVPACDMHLFTELQCEPSWYRTDWTPLKLSDAFGSMLPHADVPFTAYALRHHYAIYTLEQGWDTALSARYMGHSIKTHCDIYWLAIDQKREREIRKQREARQNASIPSSPDRTLGN